MSAAVHDVHGSTLPSTDADVIGDFGDAITQFGYGYEAHILCMTHPQIPRSRWLSDSDMLDDDVRHVLGVFTTPRRGFNGQVCWPLDEVCGDD